MEQEFEKRSIEASVRYLLDRIEIQDIMANTDWARISTRGITRTRI
jgi:hypothetical protein